MTWQLRKSVESEQLHALFSLLKNSAFSTIFKAQPLFLRLKKSVLYWPPEDNRGTLLSSLKSILLFHNIIVDDCLRPLFSLLRNSTSSTVFTAKKYCYRLCFFSPNALSITLLSILMLAGIVRINLYPLEAAAIARPMPVLPEVGSTSTVFPEVNYDKYKIPMQEGKQVCE